jgi:hypothetical protein
MNKKNNKTGFKTPEGYFEGFADRIGKRISKTNKDQEETVFPDKEGFAIPDGYFDQLNSKIQAGIKADTAKVFSLNSYRKYYYLAAASVAALILLTIGLRMNTNEEPTFEGLAKTEIEDYFEHNDLGLSTYEIAEVIPIDELEISDIMDDEIEEENIIDYLDDSIENIDELNLTDYEY